MLSFPSQNDNFFSPTDRVYSKKQTRMTANQHILSLALFTGKSSSLLLLVFKVFVVSIQLQLLVIVIFIFERVILNYATSHNEPQPPTTSHSKPQQATTHPQLRHEMNKTHKNLHSLVNALSPLSPLAAGIFKKIVFTLSPSGSCYSYNVQALFCFWWKKFGSVFVRVTLRTWQLNGEKSKYKFAAKSFLCV